jgi:putative NADPH-quinone reductase
LKVFFDNNLSPHLAHALDVLLGPEGDRVVHLTDRFRRDTEDREWLGALGSEGGWVVISADRRIHRSRIEGHPDPVGRHLLHAMADGYAEGAIAAGHEVRRIEVASLDFPLLRTQEEFEQGAIPPALAGPQNDIRWAEHWVFLFPLWHGTMPALLKGFLEHIFRPGFALGYAKDAAGGREASHFPKRLLVGRSARIVVTMGMPVLFYRWYFGAYGVRGFERSMLRFAGMKPIRESFYGLAFADEKKRRRWLDEMRLHGRRGA